MEGATASPAEGDTGFSVRTESRPESEPEPEPEHEARKEAMVTSSLHMSTPQQEPRAVINSPGQWDAMISYTQRNDKACLLAERIYTAFRERGKTVWLDIKMEHLNADAMKEAAQNSACIIAVVTGVEREGDSEDTAYMKRTYCINELRWAREAGVPV